MSLTFLLARRCTRDFSWTRLRGLSILSISEPEDIIKQCLQYRMKIQTINDRMKGPLDQISQKNTILPFVFLLGNHSSGKSSFINYVLQRKVQSTGVAPTDDNFTIVIPGPSDGDRDGPALIGDPDMGFTGLRSFGPQLIHHTQLKVRSNIALKDFMIVDTPGMIDSPTGRGSANLIVKQLPNMDRGYDFEGVCRWYAERADVILLFFDPDKPGTTGETLSILTNSLVGLDHKLHIILNKADQFRKIHDFARAYGSLCWNLSKVIQRKDLPRIYTMCLPPTFHAAPTSYSERQSEFGEPETLGLGLMDLESSREEVVAEVFNAPKRRVDNEISRLADAAAMLHMHGRVIEDVQRTYRRSAWKNHAMLALSVSTTAAVSGSIVTLGMPPEAAGGVFAMGMVFSSGLLAFQSRSLDAQARQLVSPEALGTVFKRIYARKIAEKDEFTQMLWTRVSEVLTVGLSAADLRAMKRISAADMAEIERVLDGEVPRMRRLAGPVVAGR